MKQRKRILKTVSSIALITSAATLNLRAATTFYVDSAWKGTQSGTPSQPWRYLSSSAWLAINRALESDDVTVYFPARQATSDSEAVYDSTGDGVQDGIDLTRRTDTSKSALRLDANSLYIRSETAPDWAERVRAAHAEGFGVVAGAIDWDGGRRPRALAPYAPGPGRVPGFSGPLLAPSVLPGIELERLDDVEGLPAYAAPRDEPWVYDGRIVLRARPQSGRRPA